MTQFYVFFVAGLQIVLMRNAFDDQESKQINMARSIHKFKYMFHWGLGVDPHYNMY